MTRYLAIETSSPRLSLAIGDEFKIMDAHQGPEDWRHAESLFEGTQKLLSRAGWSIQSLTGVAVSVGPGSFTGIRIGLAVARALGQSLAIPVVGVSALEILAAGANASGVARAADRRAARPNLFRAFSEKGAGLGPPR